MKIEEINKMVVPTIKEFPYEKLFFDCNNIIWVSLTSIDYSETVEFKIFPTIIQDTKKPLCISGYLKDSNNEEYDIYCIYTDSKYGKIYFITIVSNLGTYTFSYQHNKWSKWNM